ncbi:MAG: FtsW/RodA/SpoVE family cell cycle protein [Bacteroidales bacterium]|nr:FtsW/RodA/SpoVE family cell cycle protein [Bacteroidales bacterium]
METAKKKKDGASGNGFWHFIDNIEGDKVVWIIVFLLIMISILAIFSSTSLLREGSKDRMDFILDHILIAGIGLMLIFGLYNIKSLKFFRVLSKFGFAFSLLLLLLLDLHVRIPGVIMAERINGAWRTLRIAGLQMHVFEVVKVAMVMYLAWAINAYKEDQDAIGRKKPSGHFRLANSLAKSRNLSSFAQPFWKRVIYMYLPILIVCLLTLVGSGSSAIFIGVILIATVMIGGMPVKEIAITGAAGITGLLLIFGIYTATDGKVFGIFERFETMESRIGADYDAERLHDVRVHSNEFYQILDEIKQPYSAKIAVHEGGILGKGSGNSTQKYVVSNIYGDYMFSFLVEEYGLIGGILVIFLYVSLLARGSTIARLCNDEYAKITVGGLSILITGQAFMHMFVNVDIGPMTGQTLPLISHGSFAFLVFCIAFGVILSISRIARNRIREEEEAAIPIYDSDKDDIQSSMDILEDIDNLEDIPQR